MGVFPVLFERLALVGKDRRTRRHNAGCGVILRRVDVARCPTDVRTKRFERLDEDGRLDRHVQGPGDTGALQRLDGRVFLTNCHQTGHFGLGNRDLFTAPGS